MCRAKSVLHSKTVCLNEKWITHLWRATQIRPVAVHIIGTNLEKCVEESESLLPCSLCVTHFRIELHVAIQLLISIIYDLISVWKVQTKTKMLLWVKSDSPNIGLKIVNLLKKYKTTTTTSSKVSRWQTFHILFLLGNYYSYLIRKECEMFIIYSSCLKCNARTGK